MTHRFASATPAMIHHDVRVKSFSEIAKPKSKYKPGFPLDPRSYPYLTPLNLATAGFFHDPTPSDEDTWDTCKCFVCGVKLGGWDEDDDPFEEHVKRGKCVWAEMVCAPKVSRDKGKGLAYPTPESLPHSVESSECREGTFMQAWPHAPKRGWTPTVPRLAQAGFVLDATSDGRDSVRCPLCEYTVEGWEAADDPWTVHHSKNPKCDFFTAQLDAVPSNKSKPKSNTKTAKRSQRATNAASHSIVSDDTEEPVASASQPKARRKTTTKTRGKKKADIDTEAELESVVESQDDERISDVDFSEPVVVDKKTKTKKGKSKAQAINTDAESVADLVIDVQGETEEEPASQPAKKKGRKTTSKSSRKAQAENDTAPKVSEIDASEVEAEDSQAEEPQLAKSSKSTKSRRQTTKSASSSKNKKAGVVNEVDEPSEMEASEMEVEEVEQVEDEPRSQTSRSTKTKKSSSRRDTVKATSKPSRKGQQVDAESEAASEVDVEEAAPAPKPSSSKDRRDTMKSSKSKPSSSSKSFKSTTSARSIKEKAAETTEMEESEADEESAKERRQTIKSSKSKSSKSSKPSKAAQSTSSKPSSRSQAETSELDEAGFILQEAPSKASRKHKTETVSAPTRAVEKTKPAASSKSAPTRPKTAASGLESQNEAVSELEVDAVDVRTTSVPVPKKKGRPPKKASAPPASSGPVAPVSTGTNHVLTQLERFANVPPSSPFYPSRALSEETPRAKAPLPRSRASPSVVLPRETLDSSVTQGATEARKVMEHLVINVTGADVDALQSGGAIGATPAEEEARMLAKLTDDQKGMTLEELVRMEFTKRYEVMAREGEGMIGQWEEKTRQARRKIEGL